MKAKSYSVILSSILAFFLFASFASAAVTFSASGNTVTADQGDTVVVTFTVTESGEGDLTDISFNTPLTLTHGSDTLVSATNILNEITNLSENATSVQMSLAFNVPTNQAIGVYTGNLTLSGNYSTEVSYNLPIQITVQESTPDWENNFCLYDDNGLDSVSGNSGDLRTKIDDIRVESGFGDDDKWYPFDSIEVDILVDNRGNDDVNNIEIAWGLYDKKSGDWVIEVDTEKDFDLRDGKDDTVTVSFDIDDRMDVDLDQLEDGGNYVFYVRATGEVDDGDDTPTCDADAQTIEVVIERDFVIATNFDFLPSDTISCNSDVTISADIYNIGERDQDDVTVKVYNKDLNIDKEVLVGDINAFDSEKFEITIRIPKDAEEKAYSLLFEVYDDNMDLFQNDDDDESRTTVVLNVEGSCSNTPGDSDNAGSAIVTANLDSGGYLGEPLVIKATITNTGSEQSTFLVNAAGYVSWANSASLDKKTLILGPGDSETIMITFDLKDDSAGDQLFKIQVVSNDAIVADQPVSVSIQTKGGAGLSGAFGDAWYLWLIGALNVILIVIIIVVAVRLARK